MFARPESVRPASYAGALFDAGGMVMKDLWQRKDESNAFKQQRKRTWKGRCQRDVSVLQSDARTTRLQRW